MSDEKFMSVNEALEALGSNMRVTNQITQKEVEFSQTNQTPLSIIGWQTYIHQWAATKGWNQDLEERSFGDWMQLFVTEISEAYEDYRNHADVNIVWYENPDGTVYAKMIADPIAAVGAKPCGIPIEIADLAIRMLHFCEHFGIDLNAMIALKMKYNETREYRHGGKKV